jgi:hypothetical protein
MIFADMIPSNDKAGSKEYLNEIEFIKLRSMHLDFTVFLEQKNISELLAGL